MTDASQGKRPLRVAIVGAGPAGFYAAAALLAAKGVAVEVDLIERLPAPFGLVRFGVAPDHQRIKRASAAFERTVADPACRFLGNVEVGRDVTVDELLGMYDQVLITTGSASDRKLGIPGEDLAGCHGAAGFVGWYNGHPDFADEHFELSSPRVVVVGVGNVALDVTRILLRDPEELAATDITSYALEALRKSNVREVVLLGRRGPAEAAFDAQELAAIAELDGVDVIVDPAQIEPALAELGPHDHMLREKVELMAKLAERGPRGAPRRAVLRFLASPVELMGRGGRLEAVRVEDNELLPDPGGHRQAYGTGRFELLPTRLVLRSIGYRAVPIPGVPFDDRAGRIPHRDGRVTDVTGTTVVPRLYVAGWIKRGPTGLIGTNKKDAQETVAGMLEDAAELKNVPHSPRAIDRLLSARGVRVVGIAEWRLLDALEQQAGRRLGKVREKLVGLESTWDAIERARPA